MGSTKTKQPEVLLGKYELGRLLGRGTFAKVYHARSLSDGAGVAVKVLDKPELVSSGAAPRILREVDAMRRLSPHPNIIRLHEVMATKTKIYLVMEHAAGGELLARLSRLSSGRLSEPSARRYFQQLLSALRFCHARGVAHRDVKPQNLLLDRHGCLKVSDFGLSALPDHLAADGRLHTSCGTPAYAAPEVLRGKGYDGARADAWSCGVILFVLLAGFLPFDDSNLALMYRKISKRDYRFPPWFPPSAKRIVSRLLDPNPETRISLGDLVELPWFKRSYSVDDKLSLLDSRPSEGEGEFNLRRSAASAMNAFDIISMSSGLDLSGLFDKGVVEERRFSTKSPVETIVERIREAGTKLGYALGKGGAVAAPAGKIRPVLSVEVSEVVPPLSVVAMKVEAGGEGEKFSFSWNDLRGELEDIIFAWHSNGDS